MGTLVNDAMAALNKANKGGELEKNYVTAAIDALNTLLTSDVSPRMASKIARFRNVLKDYAKTSDTEANATETAAEIANTAAENAANGEGATDANGNAVNDVYTV